MSGNPKPVFGESLNVPRRSARRLVRSAGRKKGAMPMLPFLGLGFRGLGFRGLGYRF